MNIMMLVAGIIAISYGFYSIYVGIKFPSDALGLAAKQERFGMKRGAIIHRVEGAAFTIAFGVMMMASGLILISEIGSGQFWLVELNLVHGNSSGGLQSLPK